MYRKDAFDFKKDVEVEVILITKKADRISGGLKICDRIKFPLR